MSGAIDQRKQEKEAEFLNVAKVCAVRGGVPRREIGRWPDAWIDESSGDAVPVEVVAAFQRRPGEDPKNGAPSAIAYKRAERDAERLTRETDVPCAFGAHQDQPFAVRLTGQYRMPVPLEPVQPIQWILTAAAQKIAKHYSSAKQAILVVDLRWMPLYDFELPVLGRLLAEAGCTFREVWIVSEFGHVQRAV